MQAKGFVFGKFYPLHLGHLAMIRFAAQQVQQLTVLVCCSNRETIDCQTRVGWLQSELSDNPAITIISYCYDESDLPNTSVSDPDVSAVWANIFMQILPDVDLLVTSEDYGDYVASYMGIRHILFDKSRHQIPVSATHLRDNILGNWQFLPQSVKASFQKKIIISGTESTGKTTLTQSLSNILPATPVIEVARQLIASSQNFSFEDLYKVADAHTDAICRAKQSGTPLVIVDTDIYVTQSYAQFVFNRRLNLSNHIYNENQPDLRLYLDASVPFVQDGSRLNEWDRKRLDASHKQTLQAYGQTYSEITGANWDKRQQQAIDKIKTLFDIQWHQ